MREAILLHINERAFPRSVMRYLARSILPCRDGRKILCVDDLPKADMLRSANLVRALAPECNADEVVCRSGRCM